MQKKYIIILLVTLGVIVISGAIAIQSSNTNRLPILPNLNPAGQSPAYNEPPIDMVPSRGFPLGTPSSTPIASPSAAPVSDTGALLVAPPVTERQAYEELYALLDRGKIEENGFTIEPIPQERKIFIYLDAPFEETLLLAKEWLVREGYEHIPKENIRYREK